MKDIKLLLECAALMLHMDKELRTRTKFPFGGLTCYSHSKIKELAKNLRDRKDIIIKSIKREGGIVFTEVEEADM